MGWYLLTRDSVLIEGFRLIGVRNGDCWRGMDRRNSGSGEADIS